MLEFRRRWQRRDTGCALLRHCRSRGPSILGALLLLFAVNLCVLTAAGDAFGVPAHICEVPVGSPPSGPRPATCSASAGVSTGGSCNKPSWLARGTICIVDLFVRDVSIALKSRECVACRHREFQARDCPRFVRAHGLGHPMEELYDHGVNSAKSFRSIGKRRLCAR